MATIAGLVVEISANARKFHSAVRDIKSRAQKFARQLRTIIGAAVKTVVAGATAAAAAVTATVTQTSLAMRDLVRDAEAVGTTARDLQTWQFAAQSMGVEADKVGDIMKDMQDKIGDFVRTGGGEAADVFEQLGLNAQEFIGLAPDQALLRIGSALDGLSQGEKIFFMESIADDASRLLPLLDNNAERFEALAQQGREWGNIMTDAEIKASAALGRTLSNAGKMATGFKNLLGANLAPTFQAVVDWLGDITDGFGGPRQAAEAMARGVVKAMRDAVTGVQAMMKSLEEAYYWYVRIRELELNAQAALEAAQNAVTPGEQATPAMDALGNVRQTRSDLEAGEGFGSGTVQTLDKLLKRMDDAGMGVDKVGQSADAASEPLRALEQSANNTATAIKGLMPTGDQDSAPGVATPGDGSDAPSAASGWSTWSSIKPMTAAEAAAQQASQPAAFGASSSAASSGLQGSQAAAAGRGPHLGTLTLKSEEGGEIDVQANSDELTSWLADTLSGAAASV